MVVWALWNSVCHGYNTTLMDVSKRYYSCEASSLALISDKGNSKKQKVEAIEGNNSSSHMTAEDATLLAPVK